MEGSAIGRDLRDTSVEVVITLGGMVTSLATVAVNYLLARFLDFDLLSMSFWFVVPAGALLGGMAAASGYYAAARYTETMPSRKLMWNMATVGVSTWALAKWVPYATLEFDDGTSLADVVPFWDYLKLSIESTQLAIGPRAMAKYATTGELGTLGYVREVLQLLGFTSGGFAVFGFLSEVEACESCRRYANTETLLKAVPAADFDAFLADAKVSLPGFAEEAQAALRSRKSEGVSLVLARCPQCAKEWVRPEVIYRTPGDVDSTKLRRHSVDGDAAATFRAAAEARRPKP